MTPTDGNGPSGSAQQPLHVATRSRTPRPFEPKFEVDRLLFPFESRFLSLRSGARVHYVDEGEGPVLLFLHGNPTWSFLYRKIIKNLASSFRCIALDYPGFGLSSTPTGRSFAPEEHAAVVAELVEHLALRNITVMVQDWGGPIGFQFAIAHPGRLSGFIIGNTWAWPLEKAADKDASAPSWGDSSAAPSPRRSMG